MLAGMDCFGGFGHGNDFIATSWMEESLPDVRMLDVLADMAQPADVEHMLDSLLPSDVKTSLRRSEQLLPDGSGPFGGSNAMFSTMQRLSSDPLRMERACSLFEALMQTQPDTHASGNTGTAAPFSFNPVPAPSFEFPTSMPFNVVRANPFNPTLDDPPPLSLGLPISTAPSLLFTSGHLPHQHSLQATFQAFADDLGYPAEENSFSNSPGSPLPPAVIQEIKSEAWSPDKQVQPTNWSAQAYGLPARETATRKQPPASTGHNLRPRPQKLNSFTSHDSHDSRSSDMQPSSGRQHAGVSPSIATSPNNKQSLSPTPTKSKHALVMQRYHARKKQNMIALEQEVVNKMQQVQLLTDENRQLKQREEVLGELVGVSGCQLVNIVMQQVQQEGSFTQCGRRQQMQQVLMQHRNVQALLSQHGIDPDKCSAHQSNMLGILFDHTVVSLAKCCTATQHAEMWCLFVQDVMQMLQHLDALPDNAPALGSSAGDAASSGEPVGSETKTQGMEGIPLSQEQQAQRQAVMDQLEATLRRQVAFEVALFIFNPGAMWGALAMNLQDGSHTLAQPDHWMRLLQVLEPTPQQEQRLVEANELLTRRLTSVLDDRRHLLHQLAKDLQEQSQEVEFLQNANPKSFETSEQVKTKMQITAADLEANSRKMSALCAMHTHYFASCVTPLQQARLVVASYPFVPSAVCIMSAMDSVVKSKNGQELSQ